MTQLERLLARVAQVVEDSPGQMIEITVTVDCSGNPVCWKVNQARVEGMQTKEEIAV
jgi:hypothetical protein